MKITIIGAGPIGCYAGYLFAKLGHQVSIYEKKKQIGTPIQCTGLLTSDFDQFGLEMDSFLVNTFEQIEVNSSHKQFILNQKEYLVCRTKFDNYFADLARSEGVRIHLGHSFVSKGENGNLVIKDLAIKNSLDNKEKIISTDIVIAADGPLSKTAKEFGLYNKNRQNYFGIQAVVKGKFQKNKFQTFFGQEVCPDLFVWVVPESDTLARVGLATMKEPRKYFDRFMQEKGFEIVEMQAGIIPLFDLQQKIQQGNCYLLGDASSYVKATTLGGLIPGMKQAQILVRCINEKKDYRKEVKGLRRKMKLHLLVHNIISKFSDKDWDKLLELIKQPRIQKILQKHTRENPLPILLKSLLIEPRFLYFVKYLVHKNMRRT